MFIQNCAATDISSGMWYKDPGQNSIALLEFVVVEQ